MKDLRIVFMGTPEFAVASLAALLQAGLEVVGVVTAPDRPAGRGLKLQQSAVKQFGLLHGLKVIQPTNLKSGTFLAELGALKANLQIVVAFRMLPKAVWNMPALGTFNLHASLLPNYRGAAPINWAIINGETMTGVTTFFIDDKIDTGEIILQEKLGIGPEETAGALHDELMALGAKLVVETALGIAQGTLTTTPQTNIAQLKTAHKLHKESCEINWTRPLDAIYDQIRGLSPYPTAWTTIYNGDSPIFLKIYRAAKEFCGHNLALGSLVIDKKTMKVAVENGFVHLLEIQLPGKRAMKTSEALNGLNVPKTAYVA